MSQPLQRPPRAALLAALPGLLAVATCAPQQESAPRPDIVLYLCDTLRPDHLGVYGYERDTSPTLDALAKDSIVFDRAFSSSSWTKASTATLLSGLDPFQHLTTGRDTRLPGRVKLLSEILQEQGYYTVGIVTNPFVSDLFGFEQGYDEFKYLGRAVAEKLMNEAGEALKNRPLDKPLFLYLHAIDTHAPYSAPDPYQRSFTDDPHVGNPDSLRPGAPERALRIVKDSYDGEIRYHDFQLSRLIGRLKREGLYDDCLFWFTSDHGDEFLEHDRAGHGRQLFDESIHVPMILKLPGNRKAGTRVESRAALLDVVPTTLGYLDLFPPEGTEGIDLLAHPEGWGDRPPLFLDLDLMVEELFVADGVVEGDYKYMKETLPEPRAFLFDRKADPEEHENLIDTRPEVAEKLATLLRLHQQSQQSGITLRAVGEGTQHLRARIRTEGVFTSADTLELESGDTAEIGEDRKVVDLDFALVEYLSDIGQLPTSDIDTVTLKLDPPDAAVVVESLELDDPDAEFPLYLGLDRVRATVPHSLHATDAVLQTPDVDLLFQKERSAAGSNVRGDATRTEQPPAGLYVVALQELAAQDIESLPEDVRQELQDLGYLGR